MVSWGMGLTYEDECFRFTGDFRRRFTRDREIEPSNIFFFQLEFKHLGEIRA